jgi:integrase
VTSCDIGKAEAEKLVTLWQLITNTIIGGNPMASLFTKNRVYYVRFRYAGRSFKRTLETDSRTAAEYKQRQIDTFLDGLKGGHEDIPKGLDTGAYIVSLGSNQVPVTAEPSKTPDFEAQQTLTVESVIERYIKLRSRVNEESYLYTQRCHLGRFSRYLKSQNVESLVDVTESTLDDFLWGCLEGKKASTKQGYRASLIQFFKWLVKQQEIVSSPARSIETIPPDSEHLEFWSTDQIDAYAREHQFDDQSVRRHWQRVYYTKEQVHEIINLVCARAFHPTVCLLHAIPAYTGCRRGEALKLLHSDINLDGGFITFQSKKQSRSMRVTKRRVPILPELRQLLISQIPLIRNKFTSGGNSEIVLRHPLTGNEINPNQSNRLFNTVLRGTHLEAEGDPRWYKLRFHTYRHSFISNLACAGTDQRLIDEWVGHTTEAMRQRYRHLFPNMQHDAISVLSAMTSD